MRRHRAVVLCLTGLLSTFSATAQLTFPSLNSVWQYAVSHHPAIVSAQSSGRIAQAGVRNAYGNVLPTVTITGGFTDNLPLQPTLVPASLLGGPPDVFQEVVFGKP